MLAQVHRCAVLRGFDPEVLSPHTTAELERIDRLLDRLDLAPPSIVRLPLWVEADVLAAYLGQASDTRRSLWHFLAERHERSLNIPVSPDAIRVLVEGRPTLLVLDGYDEVPPSHRHAVMEHVMDFADEMQIIRANTSIVVTSRSQAYEDELRSHQFVAWSLAQLTPEAAERHAAILAGPDDDGQVLHLFHAAMSRSAVLDLLNTPLHVALLMALLAESGPPPTGRHLLFSRYYDHVYVREQGRGGEIGAFLEKYRGLVDELHRRAAFCILAAADGSDHRGIAADEFSEIARSLVRQADLAEGDKELDIVQQLIRFSSERLVLIVGVDSGEVGFQIKSFTEFLAAAHLARTPDESLVRERFRAVAASEPWRNVARFMAAAVFEAESLAERDLRDSVVTALAELDQKEFACADALLLRGAELAIDLLLDVPDMDERYRRHLIPSSHVIANLYRRGDTLAAMATSDFDDRRIADLICTLYAPPTAGARDTDAIWRFLNKLAEHGNAMAAEAAREYANSARPDVLPRLMWDIAVPQVVTPEELASLLRKADPNTVRGSSMAREVGLPAGWSTSAWDMLHGGSAKLRVDVDLEGIWHLMGPRSLKGLYSRIAGLSDPPAGCHPHWSAWARVGQALQSQAPSTVNAMLQALPELKEGDLRKDVPWPLQELLSVAARPASISVHAWYAAEDRWRESGVCLHDVETYLARGAVGRHVEVSGFPFSSVHWSTPGQRDTRISTLARDVWRIWRDNRKGHADYRVHIAGNVLVPMCDYAVEHDLDIFEPYEVREILYAMPDFDDVHLAFPTICHALSKCSSDEEFGDLATQVVHSQWSRGHRREVERKARDIVQRAHRVLPEVTFRTLCRKIAVQSSSHDTWDALTACWIEPAHPRHADWPLTNLLRRQAGPPGRHDIARAAAVAGVVWDLFDLTANFPFWSEETRAWVQEELLIQIGEPWMANAPTLWPRTRQPVRPLPLSELGLSIP
jgi:hypothetical protein